VTQIRFDRETIERIRTAMQQLGRTNEVWISSQRTYQLTQRLFDSRLIAKRARARRLHRAWRQRHGRRWR
jgi:hypothetical protein